MKEHAQTGPLVNEKIRAKKMQLITHEGKNVGTVSREDALRMAEQAGLDLVIITDVGPEGNPIAKIMDFGKALYAKKKKQSEAKKKQKVIKIKEIKMRPKISEHDYQTKFNQMVEFIKDGMRAKVTLVFRGRESATGQERGSEMFDKIDQELQQHGFKNLVSESDMRTGQLWSKIYYLKDGK